jgi:hypothetical protein
MDIVFALLLLALVIAEMAIWTGGTMTVLVAIFRPMKVAQDRKAKRLLVIYFVNAAVFLIAHRFPEAANVVVEGAKSLLLSSAPYAEGSLALLVMLFIWVSPFVVIGFLVWLFIDVLAGAVASKIERKQRDRQ